MMVVQEEEQRTGKVTHEEMIVGDSAFAYSSPLLSLYVSVLLFALTDVLTVLLLLSPASCHWQVYLSADVKGQEKKAWRPRRPRSAPVVHQATPLFTVLSGRFSCY